METSRFASNVYLILQISFLSLERDILCFCFNKLTQFPEVLMKCLWHTLVKIPQRDSVTVPLVKHVFKTHTKNLPHRGAAKNSGACGKNTKQKHCLKPIQHSKGKQHTSSYHTLHFHHPKQFFSIFILLSSTITSISVCYKDKPLSKHDT